MRVLLDECRPRRLKQELPGHDVRTVPEVGWASKKNGELLRLAEGNFDVLLTVDRGFAQQQSPKGLSISVISLASQSNRLVDLRPLMPQVLSLLGSIQPGQIIRVGP